MDVVVGRPALAVEVEHAARSPGAGVEANPPGLGCEREGVPRREDVDALVWPLRPRRAEVVRELGRAEDREHDPVALGARLRQPRAGVGIDGERGSRPCGKAEEGQNEKDSGCRPDAHHEGPAELEAPEPSTRIPAEPASRPWLESLLE
jgi:hypothetical protein